MNYRETLKISRCMAQEKDDYIKYYVKFIIGPFIYLISKTRITPNQISIVSGIFWMTGFLLIFLNLGFWQDVLGYSLFMFSWYPLDATDGAIARIKGLSSSFGALLDTSFDFIRDICNYALIVYRGFIFTGDLLIVLLYVLVLWFFLIKQFANGERKKHSELGKVKPLNATFSRRKDIFSKFILVGSRVYNTIEDSVLPMFGLLVIFFPNQGYLSIKIFFLLVIISAIVRILITYVSLIIRVIKIDKDRN